MDTLAFISRYEAILKERKIPKMQFYKDCGITDAAVSQWRKEKTKPAMTTISRIADYLGVSVGCLIGTEQKEKPTTENGSELSPAKQEAWELLNSLSDEKLEKVLVILRAASEM